jgi:transposase-like protein
MEGIFYFFNAVGEESLENARDSVKTNAAWRNDVGQSGKHSLQLWHSFAAISGMNRISRLAPQSTNPIAFFFLTSAQYLTHRPQRMQNEDSFSKLSWSAPYS